MVYGENLVAGHKLGGAGEAIDGSGVSQMVVQVLQGALAGDNGLDEETEHGEHSQTAVLDLLHLELSKRIGVVSKAQRVEGATGVEAVKTLSPVEAGGGETESLSLSHEDDGDGNSGHDGLGVDQAGVAEVVEAIVAEDGSAGLEPDSIVTEISGTVGLQELGGDASQGTKHSPASMDELDLAIASKGLGVGGQAGGIPAVVTRVFTVQVRGGAAVGEGAQELGAVRAVPECMVRRESEVRR